MKTASISNRARIFGARLVMAGLAVLALFGPLAAKLFIVEARSTAPHSTVVVAPHQEQTFANDLVSREVGGRFELLLHFTSAYPEWLFDATRLDLFFSAHDGALTFDDASVDLGNGCRFVAAAPGTITGSPIAFARQGPCRPRVDAGLVGTIRILVRKDAKVAVLAADVDPREGHGLIRIKFPTKSGANAYAKGLFWPAPAANPATVSEHLARMWRLAHHHFVFWIAACALILFLALQLRHVAIGAGAAAFSLAAGYAIVTPPFQAPDEPTHFLTFAQTNARGYLREDARMLADETHFNRLVFRTHEIFTNADAERPWKSGWQLGAPPAPGSRSRLTSWIWQAIGSALPVGADAPFALLSLRLFNGLVFAFAVGLGAQLVALAVPNRAGVLVALCPFFLMPVLPYLGMFASDHAALVSGYVLSGLILTRMLIRGRIEVVTLAAITLTLIWLIASGRGGLLALAFWIPACAFLALKRWIPDARLESHATRLAGVALAGLAFVFLYGVLRYTPPIPSLTPEGELPVTAVRYVYLSLKELLVMLAPQGRQSWMMDFVWAGFGWLDAIPPPWFVNAGKLVALAGVALTLIFSLQRPTPALWFLFGGAVCLVAYAATLAYAAYAVRANLHGRYLIGLFTVALPVAFAGWRETELRLREMRPAYADAVTTLLLAVCIATHAYMFQSLVGRYFGV